MYRSNLQLNSKFLKVTGDMVDKITVQPLRELFAHTFIYTTTNNATHYKTMLVTLY